LQVDVDGCPDTACDVGMVKIMPTFKVRKGGKEVAEVRGAKEHELMAMVKDNCT